MHTAPTTIDGLSIIEHDPFTDERGSFERWWCKPSLEAAGLESSFTQMSISRNTRAGTLRGMHVAVNDGAETKLIRCIKGRIFDVIADVRSDSPSFGMWQAFTLDASVPLALHVAPGLAHGFLSLSDDAEVLYCIDTPYLPEAARTIHYRDARLDIRWPRSIEIISERDDAAASLAVFLAERATSS